MKIPLSLFVGIIFVIVLLSVEIEHLIKRDSK